MKKSINDASAEEILEDLTHWEDPDSLLHIGSTEDGCVFVGDNEWHVTVVGETFKKALINFQLKKWNRYYSREKVKEVILETKKLDWSPVLHKVKPNDASPSEG